MSILKVLGRVSTETKTKTGVSVDSNSSGGQPYNPKRYCNHVTLGCTEIFKKFGKVSVGGAYTEESNCRIDPAQPPLQACN